MKEAARKIPIVFYRTGAGADVVLEWLRGLGPKDRALVGQDLMRVQFRWPVGMPLCRPLGDGLWRFAATCPATASHACFSASQKGNWWRCTAL